MTMKKEILEKLATLVTAAFGFVAALAWNTAIQALFRQTFGEQSSIPAMLTYAIAVTLVAVIITIYMGRITHKAK
jgi:hypothetical protein